MNRIIAFVMALVWVLSLSACGNEKQEQVSTYSFRGEHESFAVSNGLIVLSGEEEVFDGGDLTVMQADLFKDTAAYSATFYTMRNGAQSTLLSSSVVDYTGGSVHVEEDLGRVSGDGIITGSKVADTDEWRENLWFELKTTDLNGEEHVYQIQLTVTE